MNLYAVSCYFIAFYEFCFRNLQSKGNSSHAGSLICSVVYMLLKMPKTNFVHMTYDDSYTTLPTGKPLQIASISWVLLCQIASLWCCWSLWHRKLYVAMNQVNRLQCFANQLGFRRKYLLNVIDIGKYSRIFEWYLYKSFEWKSRSFYKIRLILWNLNIFLNIQENLGTSPKYFAQKKIENIYSLWKLKYGHHENFLFSISSCNRLIAITNDRNSKFA